MPAFGHEEWGRDGQRGFTIQARVSRAVWPGGAAVCSIVSAPAFFPDLVYLTDQEGRAMELRPYKFRMLRG
jgi:hypothetical protein